MAGLPKYDESVFVNCPFDADFRPLFDAIVFAIVECGYRVRCAFESDNGGEVRIQKIQRIIGGCRFGIHDLSRTESDLKTGLPRFNMPLELGIFLGAAQYGDKNQKKKNCLILDVEKYRFQSFISDIAGQDVKAHGRIPTRAIKCVRDWLNTASGTTILPGHLRISTLFGQYMAALPNLANTLNLDPSELAFDDYLNITTQWLDLNGSRAPAAAK